MIDSMIIRAALATNASLLLSEELADGQAIESLRKNLSKRK
jgi:predicted nucleic acid-binding protein